MFVAFFFLSLSLSLSLSSTIDGRVVLGMDGCGTDACTEKGMAVSVTK
jgi:hypothetical protein